MAYYVIASLRENCLGSSSDTSQDTTLNRFGAQADSLIDDELYIVANRNRKLTSLPALPLTQPPQSIKDAATDWATALFRRWQGQADLADQYEKQAKSAVRAYIIRLDSESEVYGVPLD